MVGWASAPVARDHESVLVVARLAHTVQLVVVARARIRLVVLLLVALTASLSGPADAPRPGITEVDRERDVDGAVFRA